VGDHPGETAKAFAAWEITQAHAQVIRTLLAGRSARRLDPGTGAFAESRLAQLARIHPPHEVKKLGEDLINTLDQDGPEPDTDLDNQINELHLSKSHDRLGGRITGRLDSPTFDAISQVLDGLGKPYADEHQTLTERQTDALGGNARTNPRRHHATRRR
jgi:hypothetical protein